MDGGGASGRSCLARASAWAALRFGARQFRRTLRPWTHNRATGSTAAGPYTRAIIARDGLLALSRARSALLHALTEDEHGRR